MTGSHRQAGDDNLLNTIITNIFNELEYLKYLLPQIK